MTILQEIETLFGEFLRTEGCQTTIKFLDKRLCEMGDLMIKSKTDTGIHFDVERLGHVSAGWPLQVGRVSFDRNMAHVWFARTAAFQQALTAREWEARVKNPKDGTGPICVEESVGDAGDSISMTKFRARALSRVLKNCFAHAGYATIEEGCLGNQQISSAAPAKKLTFVQQKRKTTYEQHDDDDAPERHLLVEVLAGPVLTEADLIDADDYIKRRSNEMQLIAQHRYGVRIHDVNDLERIVASLGRSGALVDVLQPKHTGAIDLRAERKGVTRTPTSSKGASFILYNFARLTSIFKKYERMREDEGFPPLPPVDAVDFTLLTDPEEWHLLYVYVLGFPSALERTLGDGRVERVAPHHILEFTFGLVACLSKYYRRRKILTDNRPKLLPVMLARLHLLEAVFQTLQTLLKLLDLEPIEEM